VEKGNKELSIRQQCEILSLSRSSLYYERIGLSEEDQRILEEMVSMGTEFLPFLGIENLPLLYNS
jgi:putative transposase